MNRVLLVYQLVKEDGFIKVQIVDTGCGIPIEHLPNIKKKFYKANHVVRGSGIGLLWQMKLSHLA